MPRFAANLTMLFTEAPFMERFALARAAGFTQVEYLFPYAFKSEDLKAELAKHGLQQVLFNLPAGDWAAGERGIAALPGRSDEFRAGVPKAIAYAQILGVNRLNCLAGKRVAGCSDDEHWQTLVQNVRFAGDALAAHGIELVVEPINHFDIPTFFLNRTDHAIRLLDEVGLPNVRVQYDIYHAQHRRFAGLAARSRDSRLNAPLVHSFQTTHPGNVNLMKIGFIDPSFWGRGACVVRSRNVLLRQASGRPQGLRF